jgi:hypothetical protein
VQRFAQRIRGAAGEDRQREHSGPDNTQCKYRKGETPCDRPQRVRCLRRRLDIGHAVRVQGRRGRYHYKKGHDIGDPHPYQGVDLYSRQLARRLVGAVVETTKKAACMARTATPVAMEWRHVMRVVSLALTVAFFVATWKPGKIVRAPQP